MIKRIIRITSACLAAMMLGVSANAAEVHYTSLGVPLVNSSFKTYMDYRMITNRASEQYRFIDRWGWVDYNGFLRCDAEEGMGIDDNYYLVALGSYYGTTIGEKYRFTTDTGNVFYGVLADLKDDGDTDENHQYSYNYDVIEFLVDTYSLYYPVKVWGSANVYMPLNGIIAKVERMDFY